MQGGIAGRLTNVLRGGAEMKLRNYLEHYIAARDLSASTISGYRTVVRRIDSWRGSPVKLKHLSDEFLNDFLTWSLNNATSRYTTKTRRTQLLVLARGANEDGLSEYEPRKVKTIKCPRPLIDVWNVEEMQRLQEAAGELKGTFIRTGLNKGRFVKAIIAVAWDTALRRGDLLRLEMDWLRSKTFTVVQGKTGAQKVCRINDSTLKLVEAIDPAAREIAFPMWAGPDRLVVIAKQAMRNAGLESPRGQFFHKIRRSSITHIEAVCKGTGWIHGGHSDPTITSKHYLNIEEAYKDIPTPRS